MIKKKYTATPIRLKELKEPLQAEAMKQDRSLNYLVVKILKEFLKKINYDTK